MDLFLFKKVVISLFTGYSSRNLSLMRGYDALTVELEQKPGGMGWGGGVIEREREGIWPADYILGYWGEGDSLHPSFFHPNVSESPVRSHVWQIF